MIKQIFWIVIYVVSITSSAHEALHGDRVAIYFLISYSVLFAACRVLDDAIEYLDKKIAEAA